MRVETTIVMPTVRIEEASAAEAYERVQNYIADVQAALPFDAPDNATLAVSVLVERAGSSGWAGRVSGLLTVPAQAAPVPVVPLNAVEE